MMAGINALELAPYPESRAQEVNRYEKIGIVPAQEAGLGP